MENVLLCWLRESPIPFFADAIQIIEDEIKRKKYSMVIRHVESNEDEVDVALELVKEKRLAGIIFLGGYFSHSDEKLRKLHIPFILSTVGCAPDGMHHDNYSSLSVDDEKEGYRMTDYLIRQGHTRIAILAARPNDASIGKMRLNGYKRALKDHGIRVDETLICHMPEEIKSYSMESGYVMTRKLMDSGKEFTAIFALSDTMAVGACRAIFEEFPVIILWPVLTGLSFAAIIIPLSLPYASRCRILRRNP